MSDRRRKYSSESSSDDSYERREKRKKSKYHHKEHRRNKKEHRRDDRRRSRSHDRKKYRHDDRDSRDKYRSKHHSDRKESRKDVEHRDKPKKYEHDKKILPVETKKPEVLAVKQSLPDPQPPCVEIKPVDVVATPSTSTNNINATITLPPYYNSNVVNAQKFAEQQKKRKLLWSKKTEEPTQWTNLKFSQDNDGSKANKFMRLMGIKEAKEETSSQQSTDSSDNIQKSDEMLRNMEQQYEVARNITHLSRGVGLGFK